MLWPSFSDYELFIKNAFDFSVLDPILENGKPMKGISGGFSRVYPVKVASKTFALRCWVKDVGNAQIRYEKISTYLKQIRLPYFVDFEYVSEGVLINGTKYPVTRMEWADGVSLRKFIEGNLRDPHILKVVATEFQKMVAVLHKHQIAHGDLQDGNILLERSGTGVKIKLIDYDSLSVPALHGQTEQIVGLPEYQHPQRIVGGGKASEKVDYFSELVIYLSFLSLSEKPDLWVQFGDEKRVDRGLLFSKKDFEDPDQSDIFQQLENLSPDVQQLAAALKDFCAKTSIDQLEPLETVLPKQDANTYSSRGDFFRKGGQYNEALAEYQKAIDIKPDYEMAHFGCGHVYRHIKQYANAINAFQEAIKFKKNYKEAYHGLGIAYFESGDNNKAIAAANEALSIDAHYQPARQLLAAIKSTMPPPVPPKPPGPVPPSPDPTPNPVTNFWQYVTEGLKYVTEGIKSNWHSATAGTLGLALAICFIAFLTQMDAKDTAFSQNTELTKQLAQKESEIRQKGLEIQSLTSSVQTLKSTNQKLSRDNGELQKKLDNRTSTTNTTFGDVISLRRQLNEQEDENQEWQARLIKKDTEIQQLRDDKAAVLNENRELKKQLVGNDQGTANQTATIQRLQREKTETLTQNRNLQKQLTDKTSEAKKLTEQVQQLQNEKVETQRQNQKLQSENAGLIRQNRSLRNENTSLRDQLDKAKQGNAEELIGPEPPKKIRIQNYRSIASRAVSRNNQGCIEFERNNYNKAIKQFEQAIRVNSEFAVAHYNLGCAYLEVKEYPKAISAFGKAVAVNYKLKEAYYNLGITHLRKGARQAAKSSVELALTIDKNYQRAHNLLMAIENAQR
ncbi:MAG: tetratricopeptide repeat protein [Candidatus Poribacteria bacterium]|nr:tetratricopeptide repeat protein [Candidatus Poribacteria bacterium]